jgi:uncharacterized protein (DUF305 family)
MNLKWIFFLVLMIPIFALSAPPQSSDVRDVSATTNSEWILLQQSMEKMHAAMMTESSQNADVDFVKLMLPHHQAAIDMAKAQLLYGTDPQMHRLAQEIIADQQSEMELMQLWLRQHDSHK